MGEHLLRPALAVTIHLPVNHMTTLGIQKRLDIEEIEEMCKDEGIEPTMNQPSLDALGFLQPHEDGFGFKPAS